MRIAMPPERGKFMAVAPGLHGMRGRAKLSSPAQRTVAEIPSSFVTPNRERFAMLEILGVVAAGAATIGGYVQSRGFTRKRLRFVEAVRSPFAPVIAAVGATLVAAPVVAILPLVGAGTAVLFGAGVGAGVAAGARDSRRLPPGD
jgi:hypothetical protein